MEKKQRQINWTRLRETQGCLTDCVAYVLNLHPYNVPFFVKPRKRWNERLKGFFLAHGWKVYWVRCEKVPRRGTHIVIGNSLKYKTYAHAVVYRNGKLAYDPQYPSKWKDGRTTHRLVTEKL